MTKTEEIAYYRKRELQELAASDAAEDTAVSKLHRDLSERYRRLAQGAEEAD